MRSGIIVTVEKQKYYIFVSLCARASACARTRECMFSGAWACARACVHVAFLIQHGKRMRHIVTSFVPSPTIPNFSTLSHKLCDFRKNSY